MLPNPALFSIFFVVLALTIFKLDFANADGVEKVEIKDYGVRGHVFPIIEQSLLEIIMNKLTSAEQDGLLSKLQEKFKKKVVEKISRPTPVQGLIKATKNRSWKYDPSFVQKTDIKDHTGKVIIPAGTKINPLEKLNWGKALIFIDGDDKSQIAWVKLSAKAREGTIVLTKGNPLELTRKLNQDIFFDQGGVLTSRFNIQAIPTVVEQEDKLLKISEININ